MKEGLFNTYKGFIFSMNAYLCCIIMIKHNTNISITKYKNFPLLNILLMFTICSGFKSLTNSTKNINRYKRYLHEADLNNSLKNYFK